MVASEDAQAGAVTIVIIGVLLVGLGVVGLAVDGARLFTARRDLQNVVDAAALAGASQVDESMFRASEGAVVALDPSEARRAALESLAASGVPAGADVELNVSASGVAVRVRREVATTFLRIIGDGEEQIGASAHAAPRTG